MYLPYNLIRCLYVPIHVTASVSALLSTLSLCSKQAKSIYWVSSHSFHNSMLFMYSLIVELITFTVNVCDRLRLPLLPMLSLHEEKEGRDNPKQTSYPNTHAYPCFCASRKSSATALRFCTRKVGLCSTFRLRRHGCSRYRQSASRRDAQESRLSSNSGRFAKTED